MQLLGPDFASPAKFSTFVDSKFHDSKYELAAFKGKRLITAVEPRKAGHLDEEVLKQMTGGDLVRARDIYKRDVVYYPEFKLWLAMNNKPQIVGTDDGIWRRVRFVPFNCKVDDSIKIKDYAKVLFREEGPGILNRLLEGVQAWMEEGLKMSPAVAKATAEFRNDQNVIQEFFDTYTISGKNDYHASAGDLHKAYKMWANAQGEFTMRQNEFSGELARRGFEKRSGHGNVTYWWGIGLTDEGLRMSEAVNAG
jgi:putative DNA primase/helicase